MTKFNEKLAAQVNETLEKLAAMPMPAQQAAAPAQGKGWIPPKPHDPLQGKGWVPPKPHDPLQAKAPMPSPTKPVAPPAAPKAQMVPGKSPLGGGLLGR